MIVIIMLSIILSLSFGIKIKWKISQEESIFLATFGTVILVYLMGLINLLASGIYIIIIISVISFIYTIIKLYQKQVKIRQLLTLPTILYCFTMCLAYYIVKDIKFAYYDEFMFWGTNLKVMFEESCLWANSVVDGIHLVYPPFTAIMEYICCKFNGSFNEGVTYFGIITLMITAIIPIFKNEKYTLKSLLKVVLTFIITYLGIILFVYNIACLSVDCILAIFFTVSMFLAYKAESKKDYFILGILLIALTLTKTNGILLAGIVIMQIFIYNVFLLIRQKERVILKKFYMVFILLAVIITSYGIWKLYYTLNGKQIDDRHDKNYTQNIDIKEFTNAILQNNRASSRNRQIAKDFFNNLMENKIIRKYSCYTVVWVLTIVNILFIIYLIISKNRMKKLSNFIVINIGCIIYLLTTLMVFMFVFQKDQGEELLGIERYVSTYMLAMVLNLGYLILEEQKLKNFVIAIAIMLVIQNGMNKIMLDPRAVNRTSINRSDIKIMKNAKYIKENVKKDEKVYLIDQKQDVGQEFVRTRYYISPIKTNLLYEWNIGIDSKDVFYKMLITPEDFITKLIEENYNYVYIINTDEKFLKEYEEIFKKEEIPLLETLMVNEEYIYQEGEGILLKVNKSSRILEIINQQ